MALPNSTTNQPSRFSQVEVTPRGALAGGRAGSVGSGTAVPFKIIVPPNQTANAIEVWNAGGTLIFKVAANGGSVTTTLTASGAVPARPSANYTITAGSAIALTLPPAAPGLDDGVTISIRSATGFAHTLTSTGNLQTGTAAVNVATFAAFAGAGLTLRAFQGKWIVETSVGIAFT